jgi:hypothetical protein
VNRRLALKLYIVGVAVLATAILACSLRQLATGTAGNILDPGTLLTATIFVFFGFLSGRHKVRLSESSIHAMSTTAQIATVVVMPLPLAILIIWLAKALSETTLLLQGKLKRVRAMVVNTSSVVMANAAAGTAFHALHGPHLLAASHWTVLLALPAVVALAVTYYLITVLVVLVAITLNSGEPPLAVLTEMGREPLLPEMSLILIGLVLGVIWNTNELLSLLIIAPVMFSIRSFEAVARLRKETIEAVLKMAESIDYRDTQTYEHSQRLAGLTRRLAMRVELTAEHADEVVLASRVHDLGKIGISNDILLKQGPLTPEERKTMEEHPVIGATILANYSAFKTSVDIVRHHHERWDGNGYPDGLRGEEIPMGARIIAVVDAFDAMVADRPYRRGMPVTQAVDRIKDGMGSQFDPKVCAAFLQMLIDEGTYTPPERVPELRIVTAAPASSASAPQAAAR